ncbi:S-adenosyl-L-methionine-dependent methyltransferase [Delitschia confertaspora ATCC 74209]|uniref:S-adenosyl-L-methionine-dependent methyltransferase n=1 Tax=Delitschia confertaspora ATCC 74209 TaxID=1513339 RepID=A0A9P4JUP3_9PLEO|nr:S-adenosyl-L-methionine-dependent methyltransferase [Delitschia confertaspora ATCC 74209]
MSAPSKLQNWSADQYVKFISQRNRPLNDLISQIPPLPNQEKPRIHDLGCGPGNSTSALLQAYPDSRITAMDSSSDMLIKARKALGGEDGVEVMEGDLETYEPGPETALLFSNAVFHWLRRETRIPTMIRLLENLRSGGVLAIQVPDNYTEPSHTLMRETALIPGRPWSKYFENSHVGELGNERRPDLDPIEGPEELHDALIPYCQDLNIWRTTYMHVLDGPRDIVEWVRGTGLLPFLNCMEGEEEVKKEFLKEYEKALGKQYKPLMDGRVMLGYPRLFLVAVRK